MNSHTATAASRAATAKTYDVVIVGGGSGGIAAAASLLKRRPKLSVAVVEPSDTHGRWSAPASSSQRSRSIPQPRSCRPRPSG